MATMTYKFESKIGAAPSTARKCTKKYIEDGTESISRFAAKSLYGKGQLCWTFQKGGL